ncbi:MAG: hypothetical protein MUP90_03980 [Gammaproteobacteria bacterium]|nr:hypothetical protein [Gammaproteobacteria bacterium]
MKGFLAELSRRNVVRMGALYAVGGWLMLQVADVLFGLLELPGWSLRLVLGILMLGFPLVLVFAWVYEMTPEGLKRESEVDRNASVTPYTGKKLNGAVIALLAVALVFSVGQKYWMGERPAGSTAQVEHAGVNDATLKGGQMPSVASIADQDIPSIAVLPFVNMSGDADNEYFSDGLSEELLNVLAQVPGLRVAARTSSFQFKGKTGDVAEIAKQLRVGAVLEGSVRRSGDRVRITAQLIKASDGYHLWSSTFDRQLLDVFAIQDEIAEKVVEALRITLLGDQQQELTAGRTKDFEAYNQYLMARQLQAQYSYGSLARAVDLYQKVLARDPDYRDAKAALVETYLDQQWTGQISNAELQARARPLLAQVHQLDSERGIQRGDVLLFESMLQFMDLGSNLSSASDRLALREAIKASMQQAIALSPNNVKVLLWLAGMDTDDGDLEAAMPLLIKARQLDPLSLDVAYGYVRVYEETLEWDKAVAETRRMQEISPGSPLGYWREAQIQSERGDFYSAMRATEKSGQLDPDDYEMPEALTSLYLDMGDIERAAPWVDIAMAMAPEAPTTFIARVQLAKAQGDQALAVTLSREFLDKKLENRLNAQFIAGANLAWDAYQREDYLPVLDWLRKVDDSSFKDTVSYQRVGQVDFALHWTLPALRKAGENARARAILDAAGEFMSRHEFKTPWDDWQRGRLDSLLKWQRGGGDAALQGYVRAMETKPPGDVWWITYLQNPFQEDLVNAPPVAAELARFGARTRAMGERLRQEDGYVGPRTQAAR